MKHTNKFKKILSVILCTGLIAAMAAVTTGCGDNNSEPVSIAETLSVGEGQTRFDCTVTDRDGKSTLFNVSTDEKTVGAALSKLDLIQGENKQFGLYVKTVNGITCDPDKDGYYWAFYVDGAYASAGVDSTDIKEGSSYQFKAEKVQ